jgi:hypothetical protein
MTSRRLEARVRRDFSLSEAEAILSRLASLELAMAEWQSRERIEAAILLLSGGDSAKFDHHAEVAEIDWRDVLVLSGLGDEAWSARLDEELGRSSEAPTL